MIQNVWDIPYALDIPGSIMTDKDMTEKEREQDPTSTEKLRALDLFRGNESTDFVSYRAPLKDLAAQARKDVPRLYDYTDGYKEHLEEKKRIEASKPEKVIIDVEPKAPPKPQGMTNLMSLIESDACSRRVLALVLGVFVSRISQTESDGCSRPCS